MNFSVLMSVYYKDKTDFLNLCFKSMWVEQTLKPTEIVLVKDGVLTPELEQTISTWQEKLGLILKIVALEQNVGLGKALNAGLAQCSYDWIFRMDADDICLPDRFEKQMNYISENPDLVLLGGQIEEFDEKMEKSLGFRNVPCTNQEIMKSAKFRNPFNHMTVCYKKSFVEMMGGYQHHLYMEDYNLWLRVISNTSYIANLPNILVNVRSGEAMYNRRKGWNYVRSEWKLANLKSQIDIQNRFFSYIYFLVRALPRFLSGYLLGKIYQKLRT